MFKASQLWLAVEVGAEQWFADLQFYVDGALASPDQWLDKMRRDWAGSDVRPAAFYRWEMEFDAASEGPVPITARRDEANWHGASFTFYVLLLNELWEVLVGKSQFTAAIGARVANAPQQAMDIVGELTVRRLASRQEAIFERFDQEFVFDLQAARCNLEREVGRAMHNLALRPTRPLVFGSDHGPQVSTDNPKNLPPALPANPDVVELCRLLRESHGAINAGRVTVVSVARQFTKESSSHDPKAQSLLRRARRYQHLWKSADT
jgi:hypothetical protein